PGAGNARTGVVDQSGGRVIPCAVGFRPPVGQCDRHVTGTTADIVDLLRSLKLDGVGQVDEGPRTMAGEMGILGRIPYEIFHGLSINRLGLCVATRRYESHCLAYAETWCGRTTIDWVQLTDYIRDTDRG